MSPDIINAKVRRGYRGNHAHNRSRYTKQCHFCNRLMNKVKSDFYRNMISNNSDNPRQLRNCLNRTLRIKFSVSLTAHDSTTVIHSAIPFPDISRIRSPKFMLLSRVVLPLIILIFQLYTTLAQCLNQHHLLKLLNPYISAKILSSHTNCSNY